MRKRTWTEGQLREAVKNSFSYRQVIRKIGLVPAGGNYRQLQQYIRDFKINTDHFKGMAWSKGLKGIGRPHVALEAILVEASDFQSYKLKARLFKAGLKQPRCEECGWAKVTTDGRVPLELDHINGNGRDNRIENLRILCPNCHSLKPTHRGRNKKKHARVMEW